MAFPVWLGLNKANAQALEEEEAKNLQSPDMISAPMGPQPTQIKTPNIGVSQSFSQKSLGQSAGPYLAESARRQDLMAKQAEESKAYQQEDISAMQPYLAESARLQELMAKQAEESKAYQQEDILAMQKDVQDYQNAKQGIDWRPLAAMLDQWQGGGNLYRLATDLAPESPEVKRAKLNEMKRQLLSAKGSISKDQYTALKAQLDANLGILKEMGADNRFNKSVSDKPPQLTPGQKAVDVAAGKEYNDYVAGGGSASVNKNIDLLTEAIADLAQPGELSGGIYGALGETSQDYLNPKGAAVRDKIRGAIQGTLKQILGGQFTENEARATFERAYNPRLSDAENIRRAQAELNALKNRAAKKMKSMQYFEEANGTLSGYRGTNKSEKSIQSADLPSAAAAELARRREQKK